MSMNNIDIHLLGLVLHLQCPPEQQAFLLETAQRLEERITTLKTQSNISELSKLLAIVALNLHYELDLEKQKNSDHINVLTACLQQLDNSLNKLQNRDQSSLFNEDETV